MGCTPSTPLSREDNHELEKEDTEERARGIDYLIEEMELIRDGKINDFAERIVNQFIKRVRKYPKKAAWTVVISRFWVWNLYRKNYENDTQLLKQLGKDKKKILKRVNTLLVEKGCHFLSVKKWEIYKLEAYDMKVSVKTFSVRKSRYLSSSSSTNSDYSLDSIEGKIDFDVKVYAKIMVSSSSSS